MPIWKPTISFNSFFNKNTPPAHGMHAGGVSFIDLLFLSLLPMPQ